MTRLLVVDIGNTTTKVATWNGATLGNVSPTPTGSPISNLESRISAIALCSVVPSAETAFVRWAQSQGKTPFIVRGDTPAPLANFYHTPDKLGPDRLAAAVAAAHRFGAPVIIASLGTAVVVDAVSPAREYLGGAIWVGMETGLAALAQRTAGLPRVTLERASRPIGRDSEECLLAGAFHGTAALIEGLAARMRDSIGNAPLVLTGGDAELVSPLLRVGHEVVPHLTLEGIALIWEHNRGG